MNKKLITFIFLTKILGFSTAFSQHINGVILNNITKKKVEFVNMGLIKNHKSTVADELGKFYLEIGKTDNSDTLIFSRIGMKTKLVSLKEINSLHKDSLIIWMEDANVALKEISISSSHKATKSKIVGNKALTNILSVGMYSNDLGAEIGVPIKISKAKAWLKEVIIPIIKSPFDSIQLRLNIYAFEDNLPTKKILNRNLIFVAKKTNKPYKIIIDVSNYDIVTTDDFFVSIEWIKDLGNNKLIQFPMLLKGEKSFFKPSSFSNWEKIPLAYGFYTKVEFIK
jgi:hypothetical protein